MTIRKSAVARAEVACAKAREAASQAIAAAEEAKCAAEAAKCAAAEAAEAVATINTAEVRLLVSSRLGKAGALVRVPAGDVPALEAQGLASGNSDFVSEANAPHSRLVQAAR